MSLCLPFATDRRGVRVLVYVVLLEREECGGEGAEGYICALPSHLPKVSGFTSVTGSTRFMLECTLCTLPM